MKQTQKVQVLKHLKAGNSLSPIEALHLFGCFRLAEIIRRIRKDYPVLSAKVQDLKTKKFFAIYHMPTRLSNIEMYCKSNGLKLWGYYY